MPNFAVGRALIPRPSLPRCRNTRHPALEIEVRVEPFEKGDVDSRCAYCEPEHRANCRLRRDQRAVCIAARAARRPYPLSTTPAPLLKPRARHELALYRAAKVARFRLRLGGGRCAPAAIRYTRLFALRSTFPARRRQTEAEVNSRWIFSNGYDKRRRELIDERPFCVSNAPVCSTKDEAQ